LIHPDLEPASAGVSTTDLSMACLRANRRFIEGSRISVDIRTPGDQGVGFAWASGMEAKDQRPGKLPAVSTRRDIKMITFEIGNYGGRTIELVLRCEPGGDLYASIASK
jgi:hypothetical protein